MPITALPTPPSRSDPTNFATRADAFLGALPTFTTQANALEAENAAAATAAAGAVLSAKLNTNNPTFTGTLTGPGATFSGSFGYGTGAGGTVTQVTSRGTGVTLNKPSGRITMVSAAGSASWSIFTLTNSFIEVGDVVVLSVQSAGVATNFYMVEPIYLATGSVGIAFATTGGTAVDQPIINFAVIKAASS